MFVVMLETLLCPTVAPSSQPITRVAKEIIARKTENIESLN